ncbi:hypothetical protein AB832_01305 [Flavobacteriaceae bacterium (ex Bugula neritina AB1)]|nr:hypothetical protein AB832_01305 [Flavobacteriaceae bacterium (ex Bugula neritina AB1)]
MLKFLPKILVSTSQFPLLKGVRGMLKVILSKNIPPLAPFKGGKIPYKISNFEQKINALKFAKENLTPLPSVGEKILQILIND